MATQTQSRPLGAGIPPEVVKTILIIGLILGTLAGLAIYVRASGPECKIGSTACFTLIQLIITGLLTGGIYSLVALGIVIINKASGVFNFAHGFMMLAGGWLFWQAFSGPTSVQLSLIFAIIAASIPVVMMTSRIEKPTEVSEVEGSSSQNPPLLDMWALISLVFLAALLTIWNLSLDSSLPSFIVGAIMGGVTFGWLILLRSIRRNFNMRNFMRIYKEQKYLFSASLFWIGIGLGLLVGGLIYYLLRNLDDNMLPEFVSRNVSASIFRGALGALIGSAAIGLFTERFAIRPLLGQPTLAAIMMTLAVGLILQGTISLIWGTQPGALPIFEKPKEVTIQRIPIGLNADGTQIFQEIPRESGGGQLPDYQLKTEEWLGGNLLVRRNLLWGFIICILCFIGFVIFFQFTTTGLAMRAVAENQVLAESVGLRVRSILAIAWAIAAMMAMIAGVIQASGPGVGVSVIVIPSLAFRAFPAVLLGGLESITGALIGGLIIGLVEQITIGLVDPSTGQEFAPFLALLIVLMIRPDGLFGQRRIDRV